MKWLPVLTLLLFAAGPLSASEDCAQCHIDIQRQFAMTAMSSAARSGDFAKEWVEGENNPACLACHAPSGGSGIKCADCHGGGPHPYARLNVPETCARCHDAPGESTLRHHRTSLAARRNLNCLSCHVKSPKESHVFLGASSPELLSGSAKLHLALRKENGKQILVVAVRPRTGHALPGGTTGRSVWLVVKGVAKGNATGWRETWRFGWWQDSNGKWEEATLAPDIGANLELSEPGRHGARDIEAELIYRFRPGPFEEPDHRQVTIDKARMTLPR